MKRASEGTKESKDRDDGQEKKQRKMGFFDEDHNEMVVCVDTVNEDGLTMETAKKALKAVMEGPAKTRFVKPIANQLAQSARNALNVKFIDVQQLPAWFSDPTDYNNDFENGQGLYTWRRQVQINYFDKGQPPDEFGLRYAPPGVPVTPPTRNTDDPVYMGKIDLWILPSSTTWHGYAHQPKRSDVLLWDSGVKRKGFASEILHPGDAKRVYPDNLLPGNDGNAFVYLLYDETKTVEFDRAIDEHPFDNAGERAKQSAAAVGIDFWKPKKPKLRNDLEEVDYKKALERHQNDLQPFIWVEEGKLDLKVEFKKPNVYPWRVYLEATLKFRMPQAYIEDALYRVGERIYRCHPVIKRWVALDALDKAMGPGNKNAKEAMLRFMTGRVRGCDSMIPLRRK
jgi:hypothetical protein